MAYNSQPHNKAHSVPTIIDSVAAAKQFFAEDRQPYAFVSATNFNVLNMEQWVQGWTNFCLIDWFDGGSRSMHRVANPSRREFSSIEDVNSFILNHRDFIRWRIKKRADINESPGNLIFLFFNAEIERIASSLGLSIHLPSHAVRESIDCKIATTRLGNEAGVPSVPNVLAEVQSYKALCALAEENQLGNKLVVQLPYGDSGKTTFFISCEADFDAVAAAIRAEDCVKVMKHIRCEGTAIEAVATSVGTFVGPLMSELIGIDSLTPYAGGWCGNELSDKAYSQSTRKTVMEYTERLGAALYKQGYRGYFEVDYLFDQDSGQIYLGELNPRLTGATALTNLSRFCRENIPLLLLHLLEYRSDITLALDPKAFNYECLRLGANETFSQMILKYTGSSLQKVEQIPTTGVYEVEASGQLRLLQKTADPLAATQSNQCFVLNIMQPEQYVHSGMDIAIVFTRNILKNQDNTLSESGLRWLQGVRDMYGYRTLTAQEQTLVARYASPGSIKHSHNSN